MSLTAGDLPYGVVVEYCGEPYHIQDRDPEDEVDRVFVAVPDGLSWEAAEKALSEARPWVPMDWTDIPTGARWRNGGVKNEGAHAFEVHPDDVPDLDADLIERIAKAMYKNGVEDVATGLNWDSRAELIRDTFRRDARTALSIVRESEAD